MTRKNKEEIKNISPHLDIFQKITHQKKNGTFTKETPVFSWTIIKRESIWEFPGGWSKKLWG